MTALRRRRAIRKRRNTLPRPPYGGRWRASRTYARRRATRYRESRTYRRGCYHTTSVYARRPCFRLIDRPVYAPTRRTRTRPIHPNNRITSDRLRRPRARGVRLGISPTAEYCAAAAHGILVVRCPRASFFISSVLSSVLITAERLKPYNIQHRGGPRRFGDLLLVFRKNHVPVIECVAFSTVFNVSILLILYGKTPERALIKRLIYLCPMSRTGTYTVDSIEFHFASVMRVFGGSISRNSQY